MKMAVLYPTIIAFCMILLYIMPKSIAVETKDISENLSPRGVYKEVHIQMEDDSDISPRLLPEIIVLLLYLCECSIKDLKCECCFTLDVFHKKKCCLKMQYLNKENAVNGAVAYGGKTLLNFDVSANSKKENLPECFDRMSGWIKICFQFYGIRWDTNSKELQMCSKFEIYLKKKKLYETDFGCFQLGLKKAVVVMSKNVGFEKELVSIKINETNKNPLTECLLIGKDGKLNKKCD